MGSNDQAMLFGSSACLINGYGCDKDLKKACHKLTTAAAQGHLVSQAYLYRICQSCGVEVDVPKVIEYLATTAHNGSRTAPQDLRILDSGRAQTIHNRLVRGSAGVGAPWFYPEYLFLGLCQPKIVNAEFMSEFLSKQDRSETMVVNKHGDKLLHFAAACGAIATVKLMVDKHKVDINMVNALGQTPWLCSCRSGQGPMTAMLLQRYHANASITAKNGESALHWLISFEDSIIEPAGKDLMTHGASAASETTGHVAHSVLPGHIDVDFQLPGTPLAWVVHHNRPVIVKWLLDRGADPNHYVNEGRQSPKMWAVYITTTHVWKPSFMSSRGGTQHPTTGRKGFQDMHSPLDLWCVKQYIQPTDFRWSCAM